MSKHKDSGVAVGSVGSLKSPHHELKITMPLENGKGPEDQPSSAGGKKAKSKARKKRSIGRA
jgi:hypothetical protein